MIKLINLQKVAHNKKLYYAKNFFVAEVFLLLDKINKMEKGRKFRIWYYPLGVERLSNHKQISPNRFFLPMKIIEKNNSELWAIVFTS